MIRLGKDCCPVIKNFFSSVITDVAGAGIATGEHPGLFQCLLLSLPIAELANHLHW